ncbi:hypothetical protein QQ045_000721 [Rhodiola kirilowii]
METMFCPTVGGLEISDQDITIMSFENLKTLAKSFALLPARAEKISGAGKKVVDVAKKARATIDWDGLAKLLVFDRARKEFATLRLTFDEVSQIDDQQSIGFGLMLFEKL